MQQKYFEDIHDFYNFFLLKKISKNYSLGIHWCLISDDNTNDGEKKITQKEDKLDGKLFKILTQQNRKLEDIEKYFPKMTKIIYQHMDRSKYSIHNKLKKIISILKCEKEDIELLKIGNVFYIIIIQGKHIFFKDHLAMFTNSDINPGYISIENILEEKNV